MANLLASDIEAPISMQIPIMLKILSFERNVKAKAGPSINIILVYQKDYRESLNAMKDVVQLESLIESYSLEGKKLNIKYLSINTAQDLMFESRTANIIIVAPLRAIDMYAISSVCESKGILSVSTVVSYVERGFFSVGVDIKGDKLQPVINLNKVKREGAEFSSRLLNLSKVVNK
ncbi:MAG: YfiR family protein [Chloroflexota bacterium]